MGVFIKLSIILHSLVNICLGIYGLLQPVRFLATIIADAFDNSWLHIPSLDYTLHRVAQEHGLLLLGTGALFLIVAGEPALHRRVSTIVGLLEVLNVGVCLLNEDGGKVAAYHGAWAMVQSVAYYIDERKATQQDVRN